MDYTKISKDTLNHLYECHKSLKNSPLDPTLRSLIELRVSQINGCSYCCDLHRNEAIKLGVDEDKIAKLAQFVTSNLFSDSEKEVLAWAESLTKLSANKKVQNTNLSQYFSDREIVDITICISLMNSLNRLAISMRDE